MAFRQIINKVLTRLREETIATDWTGDILDSSDVDDYQKLISELVNETKQLVEDSWGWGVLRAIQTVTTSNGTALTVPEHIVILGAYSLAITERGEDGGSGSGTAAQRFQDSLSDAITQDQNRTVNETTWYAS